MFLNPKHLSTIIPDRPERSLRTSFSYKFNNSLGLQGNAHENSMEQKLITRAVVNRKMNEKAEYITTRNKLLGKSIFKKTYRFPPSAQSSSNVRERD